MPDTDKARQTAIYDAAEDLDGVSLEDLRDIFDPVPDDVVLAALNALLAEGKLRALDVDGKPVSGDVLSSPDVEGLKFHTAEPPQRSAKFDELRRMHEGVEPPSPPKPKPTKPRSKKPTGAAAKVRQGTAAIREAAKTEAEADARKARKQHSAKYPMTRHRESRVETPKPASENGSTAAKPERRKKLSADDATRLAVDVPMAVPKYAWNGIVPFNAITHMVGPSEIGKSTFATMLSAKLTTGALTGKPEKVLMAMVEDDNGFTTKPRLLAHGGNPDLVHFPNRPTPWLFPRDLDEFEAIIGSTGVTVAFIDPLQQFVTNLAGQEGRTTLGRLNAIAQGTGLALVFCHHFIKDALNCKTVAQAVGGGYGVYGIARSIIVMGWKPLDTRSAMLSELPEEVLAGLDLDLDQEDDEDDLPPGDYIVMAHEKHSIGPKHPSILYERTTVPHPAAPGNPKQKVTVLKEVRQVAYTPIEVMHATKEGDESKVVGKPKEQAKALLLMLVSFAGPDGMIGTELETRAVAAGFSKVTVQRARKELAAEGIITKAQDKDAHGKTTAHRWLLVVPDAPPA